MADTWDVIAKRLRTEAPDRVLMRKGAIVIEALAEELAALVKPASSPAGGDVREALLTARQAIWSGGDTVKAIAAIDAALSPSTSAAEPVARGADYAGDIAPHDDKARGMAVLRDAYDFDIADDGTLVGLVAGDQGWASTHIRIATPPAPAAVDGQERDRLAKLVEGLLAEPVFAKSAPARMALTIAARNVRRGRALTAEEKFDNLTSAIEEDDPDLANRLRACLATDKEGGNV